MPIAVTIPNARRNLISNPGGEIRMTGTLVLSGNYPSSGEVWPTGICKMSNKNPLEVRARGVSGWLYLFDDTAQKLRVFGSGGAGQNPLAELNAGAYPASVANDVIFFTAIYPKE